MVRDFSRKGKRATFAVDLPDNEGAIEWELRVQKAPDVAILRALTVNGEPTDNETPSWHSDTSVTVDACYALLAAQHFHARS